MINFNQYLGVEVGFQKFADSVYKAKFSNTDLDLTDSMHAFNLVGKVYLPLANNFNLYGLAGAA